MLTLMMVIIIIADHRDLVRGKDISRNGRGSKKKQKNMNFHFLSKFSLDLPFLTCRRLFFNTALKIKCKSVPDFSQATPTTEISNKNITLDTRSFQHDCRREALQHLYIYLYTHSKFVYDLTWDFWVAQKLYIFFLLLFLCLSSITNITHSFSYCTKKLCPAFQFYLSIEAFKKVLQSSSRKINFFWQF